MFCVIIWGRLIGVINDGDMLTRLSCILLKISHIAYQ